MGTRGKVSQLLTLSSLGKTNTIGHLGADKVLAVVTFTDQWPSSRGGGALAHIVLVVIVTVWVKSRQVDQIDPHIGPHRHGAALAIATQLRGGARRG